MEYLLKDREPKEALRYFEEISAIPRARATKRPSANTCWILPKPTVWTPTGTALGTSISQSPALPAVNPCPR